jgi:hypothetical protein
MHVCLLLLFLELEITSGGPAPKRSRGIPPTAQAPPYTPPQKSNSPIAMDVDWQNRKRKQPVVPDQLSPTELATATATAKQPPTIQNELFSPRQAKALCSLRQAEPTKEEIVTYQKESANSIFDEDTAWLA